MSDEDFLIQFFSYSHLPPKYQVVSKLFGDLAVELIVLCPDNEERHVALRKLLEAKDCAVRARVAV